MMNHTISMKFWQGCMLLGLSGYAFGNILAKLATAMGL